MADEQSPTVIEVLTALGVVDAVAVMLGEAEERGYQRARADVATLEETRARRDEHIAALEEDLAEAEAQIQQLLGRWRSAGHPEDRCHCCNAIFAPWTAPSPLWNAVMRAGGSIDGDELYDGIVCPTCFAMLAEARGLADRWRFSAQRVKVELETVTPSGRIWNEATWMWRVPLRPDTGDGQSLSCTQCPVVTPDATNVTPKDIADQALAVWQATDGAKPSEGPAYGFTPQLAPMRTNGAVSMRQEPLRITSEEGG